MADSSEASDRSAGPEADLLVTSMAPGVRLLTLNRPDRLNALTFALVDQLLAELEAARYDPRVRVIVLTGAGRGFCSGHDRGDHSDPAWMPPRAGPVQRGTMILQRMSRLVPLLRSLPQVVIAAVNGPAAGAGLSLALGADLVLAGESAFFVNGFNDVGGGGAELGLSYLLPRLVGVQRAAEMMLTARRIGAAEAARIGLVLRAVPDGDLLREAGGLADDIMAMPPAGVAQTKASLWANSEVPGLTAALELEIKGQILSMQTADAREKRAASAASRPPRYSGR